MDTPAHARVAHALPRRCIIRGIHCGRCVAVRYAERGVESGLEEEGRRHGRRALLQQAVTRAVLEHTSRFEHSDTRAQSDTSRLLRAHTAMLATDRALVACVRAVVCSCLLLSVCAALLRPSSVVGRRCSQLRAVGRWATRTRRGTRETSSTSHRPRDRTHVRCKRSEQDEGRSGGGEGT